MRTTENGTERWTGICIEILKALATSLNFKYVYFILHLVDLSDCLARFFVYDIHTFFIIFQMATHTNTRMHMRIHTSKHK